MCIRDRAVLGSNVAGVQLTFDSILVEIICQFTINAVHQAVADIGNEDFFHNAVLLSLI